MVMAAINYGPGLLDPQQQDRPPVVAVTPLPRIRLYKGDYGPTLPLAQREIKPGFPNEASWYAIASSFQPDVSVPIDSIGSIAAAEPNNTEVYTVAWQGSTITLTTPAGWTLAGTRTQGELKLSVFYRTAPAVGSWNIPTFVFSASTSLTIQYMEWVGFATSSQLDLAIVTGSSFTNQLSVTLTANLPGLAQVNEAVIALVAVSPQANFNIGLPTHTVTGIPSTMAHQFSQPSFTTIDASSYAHTVNTSAVASVVDVLSSRDGNVHSGDAIMIVVTFKASGDAARFARVGEFDLGEGSFTMRSYELGEFQLEVPLTDPLASAVVEDSIIECFVPDYADFLNTLRVPWTHGWYVVRHISENEDTLPRTRIFQGMDLRDLVARRVIEQFMVESGTPGTGSAEDWARWYIDKAVLTNPDTGLRISGMSLEATNGHRGTVYATALARVGSGIGDTITQLYRKDKLGWRVVVKNPGTITATLEVQTYAENDRTLGRIGQCVFKESWDTARSVNLVRDAVNASNYLVVLGPASGAVRPTYTVYDDVSIAKWGILAGEVDASTEPFITTEVARTYLRERLPKEWCEVIPRNTNTSRLGQHYNLLDRVTALTRDGIRFDGNLLSLTLTTHAAARPDFGSFLDPSHFLTEPDPAPYKAFTPFSFILGDDPAAAPDGGRDRRPADLRDYTHLKGLTAETYQINSASSYASGTPGVTVPLKTLIPNAAKTVDRLDLTQSVIGDLDAVAFNATTLKKGGVTITPTAVELNRSEGVTPGVAASGKVLVPGTGNVVDSLDLTTIKKGGVTILADAADIDRLDNVTPGTAADNKALVLGASKTIDELNVTTLKKGGATIVATQAELDRLAGVTPGTPVASKALVTDDAGAGVPRLSGTLRVSTLQAGTGANGAVADGATYNPQQSAVTSLPGDGSASPVDVELKINEILTRLRAGGEIAT